MYEFRGSTLLEAVQQAVGRSDLQLAHKKLLKRKGKFDFSARLRLGSSLFVGEGNFSFSLSLAKRKAVPASSILATAYEAEDDMILRQSTHTLFAKGGVGQEGRILKTV